MKKSMKKLIVLLVVLLVTPMIVHAEETASLNIDCGAAVPGQTFSCTVSATGSKTTVGAAEFKVSSEGASFSGFEALSGYVQDDNSSEGLVSLVTTNPVNNGTAMTKLNFTVPAEATAGSTITIKLTDGHVAVMLEDGSEEPVNGIEATKEIQIVSSSDGTTTSTSENPKTMDTQVTVIITIIGLSVLAALVGKKKLNKIER